MSEGAAIAACQAPRWSELVRELRAMDERVSREAKAISDRLFGLLNGEGSWWDAAVRDEAAIRSMLKVAEDNEQRARDLSGAIEAFIRYGGQPGPVRRFSLDAIVNQAQLVVYNSRGLESEVEAVSFQAYVSDTASRAVAALADVTAWLATQGVQIAGGLLDGLLDALGPVGFAVGVLLVVAYVSPATLKGVF